MYLRFVRVFAHNYNAVYGSKCIRNKWFWISVDLTFLSGTIKDLVRKKRPSILSDEVRTFIDDQLTMNDELTSTKLQWLIEEKWPAIHSSTTTIKRERRRLGWVCTRPHYCQLLREVSETYIMYSAPRHVLVFLHFYLQQHGQ